MSTDLHPIVGNWHRYAGKGDLFRVVAVDEDRERGAVRLRGALTSPCRFAITGPGDSDL